MEPPLQARRVRAELAFGELGVEPGDRVATLCWNHAEHLVAYLAVPCMGAVLLTLNLRLSPATTRQGGMTPADPGGLHLAWAGW
jgi:acyl-CoA synthetase (AMP-forming)/AMP-acid ligase II